MIASTVKWMQSHVVLPFAPIVPATDFTFHEKSIVYTKWTYSICWRDKEAKNQ